MILNPPPGVANVAPPAAAPLARSAIVLIALALLAPFALYLGTVESIVSIWNSSETFAHGYVILPISLWLIWRRRQNFSLYPPTPYAPALALLAVLGAGWLAAQLGEVQVVSQYTFVAMFPVAALALLGPRLAGSLAFPLLFLLFAVPFGEVFVAPLIQFTADFTVAAVQATGIPVLRSGTRFELPTGNWSVVEACSGVRYLISSITLGCLYAYLTYRSMARRALFIALSVLVPILANGLRAYMIVMIGHLSGMALATGVDHIIYGWLFFGLVMFIMFWIGSYWREDTDTPAANGAAPLRAEAGAPARVPMMAVCVVALCAVWPGFARYGEHANHNPAPVQLDQVAVSWPEVPAFADWKPDYMAPDAAVHRSYRQGATPVALTLLYYRNQDRSKSLISSLNRLAGYKDAWHETTSSRHTETVDGVALTVRETVLRRDGRALLVWDWMRVGDRDVTSNAVGKLLQAQSKLLLHGDDGAAVMLSAPFDEQPDAARATLHSFLLDNYKVINLALDNARRH
ncbi:exosortase [Massilia sp. WF1]|uniref:exosortase A n=1 Tax=unclassified Massilia TaxID=2609279 RepID=UPI0006916A4A|nr:MULTISPECIES: exosortase A [unclassified Massilia]ALK95205.1 exosortase A [Massilia sp. WG5]KNZ67466.1 exosortase [Massilia sp. WF1]